MVWGLGFGVWSVGFKVWGVDRSGLGTTGCFGIRVWGMGVLDVRIEGSFGVKALRAITGALRGCCKVSCFGMRHHHWERFQGGTRKHQRPSKKIFWAGVCS